MTWNNFIWFALPAVLMWLSAGAIVYSKKSKRIPDILMLLGIVIFAIFITGFWINIERPPMRTMGETRLWYSMFLSVVGYVAYRRWKYPWLLSFTAVVATVFVIVNLLKPEIHSKSLMPALQSPWFIPHVTAYILSYAMFGSATIGAIILLWRKSQDKDVFNFIDNMIYVGYGFLNTESIKIPSKLESSKSLSNGYIGRSMRLKGSCSKS